MLFKGHLIDKLIQIILKFYILQFKFMTFHFFPLAVFKMKVLHHIRKNSAVLGRAQNKYVFVRL